MQSSISLLPYQAQLIQSLDRHNVIIVEKSRRIGFTWGAAYAAVEHATKQNGMDVFYIGYNKEMSKDFIDNCKMWADQINRLLYEIEEEAINDENKDLLVFCLRFKSGNSIRALASTPKNLRGKQGLFIIDEAAFHDYLDEIKKAVFPSLIWGGKVLIISTHDGDENPYWELIEDTKKGKYPYFLMRVDFDDALEQGLYKKICTIQNTLWSAELEQAWRNRIIAECDHPEEELFCIPRRSSEDSYLPRFLIERCTNKDNQVISLELPQNFVDDDAETRRRTVIGWCEEKLRSITDALIDNKKHYIGMDFARSTLSVIALGTVSQNTHRQVFLMIELRNIPFDQQEQILWWLIDAVKPKHVCLDARGNGEQLAERTRQKYGREIEGIKATRQWYAEQFPKLKRAFEEQQISVPEDENVIDDLRQVRLDKGVPIIPPAKYLKSEASRHADAAVALLLLWVASIQPIILYEFDEELNQTNERKSSW